MNKKVYLLAFLLPVLIMLLCFIKVGVYPFGDSILMTVDMYHQFGPFFSELQYKMLNKGSLYYTWNAGMGINFLGVYGFLLASPFNLLLFFIPTGYLTEFIGYLTVLKIGLCGLSCAIYLNAHSKSKKAALVFFSTFYALSGYMAAYYWNLIWLDCVVLLPVIILAFERMRENKSGIPYTLLLAVSIFSNFHVSIMTCIFLVIYYVCLELLEEKWDWRQFRNRLFRFSWYSLLAGGLASILLIPEIFQVFQSTAGGQDAKNIPTQLEQYFSIIDFMARHLPNVPVNLGINMEKDVNVYCGAAVFVLLPMYFLNRGIPKRRRLVFGALLFFFYLSFAINLLDYIWHGFHFPNSVPGRQAFIYVFVLLVMAHEAYEHRETSSRRDILLSLAFALCFFIYCQKTMIGGEIKISSFYLAVIFCMIPAVLFLREKRKVLTARFLAAALLLSAFTEIGINMYKTSMNVTWRDLYLLDNEDIRSLVREQKQKDTSFYRFKRLDRLTDNDGAWLNYPSTSGFVSMLYSSSSSFFSKVGMSASKNQQADMGATPLIDMLLDVKYTLVSYEPTSDMRRNMQYIEKSGEVRLYENKYTLPIGYFATREQIEAWDMEAKHPILVQNSIMAAFEEEDVLQEVEIIQKENVLELTADKAGEYYLYVAEPKTKYLTVIYEDGERTSWNNLYRKYLIWLGSLKKGETVSIKSGFEYINDENEEVDWIEEEANIAFEAQAYRFEYAGFEALYEKLNEHSFVLSSWSDTDMIGSIEAPEDGLLMTSIPYDSGWKVEVDKKEVQTERAVDTFLAVPVTEGRHEISLHYRPEGISLGVGIFAMSFVLFIVTLIGDIGKWKKKRKHI